MRSAPEHGREPAAITVAAASRSESGPATSAASGAQQRSASAPGSAAR